VRHCETLDRARNKLQAPTRRAVGLRQDQRNLVARGDELRERAFGELGRAGED
jgi:hypothetical protein